MMQRGYSHISGRAGNSSRWDVPWQWVCAVCDRGAIAGLVQRWHGQPPSRVVLGCKRLATRLWSTSHADLATVAQGHEPTPEPLVAERAALPLALGADGVMVPFRPEGGKPQGRIRWREIKVGVLARLGQHRTRTGHLVTRLHQRRLVAVLGDIEMLTPRLWLEALRAGHPRAPQVVWLSDGGRGLWRLFEEQFAGYATGVLDFYHAGQNLVEERGRLARWTDYAGASVVRVGTPPPAPWPA